MILRVKKQCEVLISRTDSSDSNAGCKSQNLKNFGTAKGNSKKKFNANG